MMTFLLGPQQLLLVPEPAVANTVIVYISRLSLPPFLECNNEQFSKLLTVAKIDCSYFQVIAMSRCQIW